MNYKGDFTTANTVYVYFNSFDSNDPSASVTLTGLVLGDIKIYKNGSVTQRTSTAGFTLLDTDGIDFDAITGINGFSVDLSDNTDAGFYAAGGEYEIIINSVTIDAGVINFSAASFSIERTGGTLALLKDSSFGLDQLVRSTTPANTLDIEAGGTAGIDWANIANKTTAVDLSATDIQLADTVTTLTGHTPQTGDNYARLGAPAGASVSADIADVPTVAELNARTLLAASYFDPAADTVANVTTVATTTTNTDMRGTDSAALASVATEARLSELDAVTAGKMANQVDIIQTDTTTDIPASITALNDVAATDIVSGGAITTSAGAVSTVTTVGTTTTNTDMRGTDSAALASVATEARLSELDAGTGGKMANQVDLIKTDTDGIDDLAINKNAAFSNFEFLMVATSDGRTPVLGLTVTGQRSIDGAAFANVSGVIAEVSNGIYQFDALAADTNGDVITWRFSSATADDTFITFKTVA